VRGVGLSCALALFLGLSTAAGSAQTADGGVLYAVDLGTGKLTRIGAIGDGTPITSLAVPVSGPSMLWALTEDGRLIRFSPVVPTAVLADVEISGLADGEHLLGIDVRPATGELFAIGDSSTVYVIDPETGEATALGDPIHPELDGKLAGFDFNPTVDRIRVVTNTGQNLRLNPDTGQIGSNADTGEPTIDAMVAFAQGDANAGVTPLPVAAGYTNSVDGAESTQLYVIDTVAGVLALQDPPNDGVLNTVGALGVSLDGPVGFDIAPNGVAYVAR
jgi:outer membrane protein assembly factor BamB